MKRVHKSFVRLVAILIVAVPLITGCWDRSEIENRATVLSIGIDTVDPQSDAEPSVTHPPGAPGLAPQNQVRVTAQIAVPGRIPLGPGESGGGSGSSASEKPVWIVQGAGHSIEDAMMNLQQKIAFKLFLSHLRVVVLSEQYARTVGVGNFQDYMRRNAQVRRTAYMLVSKGHAATLIKTAPPLERVPALYLNSMVREAITLGKIPHGMVGEFLITSSVDGQDPYSVYVNNEGANDVAIIGLAYFRGNKLVGHTTSAQIPSFMEIVGKQTGGYSIMTSIPNSQDKVMVQAIKRKSKIRVFIQNGEPSAVVKIQVDGFISEKLGTDTQLNNPMVLNKIQEQLNIQLEDGCQSLIRQAKGDNSDFFGFGEYIRAKEPGYWDQSIRSKDDWRKAFQHMPVRVAVTTTIRRQQMKAT